MKTVKFSFLKWKVESRPLKEELNDLKGKKENYKCTPSLIQLPFRDLHLKLKPQCNSSALSTGWERGTYPPIHVKPGEGLVRSKRMFLHRTFNSFLIINPLGRRGREDQPRQMTNKMTFMPRSQ